MSTHSPLPVGAIKTKVLILLIALIVCGVAGTVILSHFIKKSGYKADATHAAMLVPMADLLSGADNISC